MDYEKELLQEMSKAIERIDSSVDGINITLAKQEANLKLHMKRSDELENHVKRLEDETRTIRIRQAKFDGGVALIGIISLLIGIAVAISNWLK